MIVTEMCVIERSDKGLVLKEIAPGVTVEDVLTNTEADLIIPDKLDVMKA